jgi:hypothetical protein
MILSTSLKVYSSTGRLSLRHQNKIIFYFLTSSRWVLGRMKHLTCSQQLFLIRPSPYLKMSAVSTNLNVSMLCRQAGSVNVDVKQNFKWIVVICIALHFLFVTCFILFLTRSHHIANSRFPLWRNVTRPSTLPSWLNKQSDMMVKHLLQFWTVKFQILTFSLYRRDGHLYEGCCQGK